MDNKSSNKTLRKANKEKNDEFYTQLSDIEKELRHYKAHFKNKVVLCNCDDPRISNFFHYFSYNFEQLGLKKLIATCYKNQNMDLFTENKSEQAIYLEYTGDKNGDNIPNPDKIGIKPLKGDGDFRGKECIDLLKEADIKKAYIQQNLIQNHFDYERKGFIEILKIDKNFLIEFVESLYSATDRCYVINIKYSDLLLVYLKAKQQAVTYDFRSS